jgi:sugar phosphate isomerase/epimerase
MEQNPLGLFIVVDEHLKTRINACIQLAIPTAQILAPLPEKRTKDHIKDISAQFDDAEINITAVFCGFEGESYADIPTVKNTVGLVPKASRQKRVDESKRIADFSAKLGVPVTAMHIGFIPEDPADPDYDNIVKITQDLCQHCERLHLETGQESAELLLTFLKDVDKENLAVNFDPANMILYGSGEPIPALELLGKYVKSVHCKDAVWSDQPKNVFGQEMPLGEGDVDFNSFFKILKNLYYDGPLTIEREIVGDQQIKDIEKGVNFLRKVKHQQL